MLAYKELQDILATTLNWEQAMLELYQVAELGLKNDEASKTLSYLMENHISQMDILKNIRIENYGPTEWVKFTADLREEDIIPKKTINRDSTAEDICAAILEYEGNLKDFYQMVTDHLNTEQQKELFQSLVQFKENQIERIQNCLKHHK